jgi:hypothetical protein
VIDEIMTDRQTERQTSRQTDSQTKLQDREKNLFVILKKFRRRALISILNINFKK